MDTAQASGYEMALAQAEAMIERQAAEIRRLKERCSPSKVVMIGDTGHYVSEAVADEITRLQKHVRSDADVYWDARESLVQRIESLNYELQRLRGEKAGLWAELNACAAVLPGPIYMDLPDGGSVTVSEQLARMGMDAARYRLLRRGQHWSVVNGIGDTLRGDGLDVAVDAAIRKEE